MGVEEYGYAAPDALDPDVVYGGKLTRYDRRTGQTQNIAPKPLRPADFRVLRTAPVMFSPVDRRTLYFAANTLWKTRDGGQNWQQISPDLSRKDWEIPASVGKYRDQPTAKPSQRGVIYALAPSPLDINRIWAGTDDGLIHVTVDGGLHWKDVTPSQLTPFAKVSVLDAGHFDARTAYAAINTLRLDEMRPHILRTHDGGKTWTEIVNGIPDGAPVDVVREDPERKGLLFAGTETQVYVSFDDGDHWESLRLNMPATSIRDLIVKGDDLAVATHGRGFWILDDMTELRQLKDEVTGAPAFLFRPQTAMRVRWDTNTDTPIPPDEGTAQNPPDGAIVDYYVGDGSSGPVTLEFSDAAGKLVRRYSSDDPAEQPDPMLAIPRYWPRPPQSLANTPGVHRFVWDLHLAPVPGVRATYPIAAVAHNTAPEPTSPWVLPGVYTVKLTAAGKSYTQKLTVRMDPRVHTALAALTEQFALSKQLYDDELTCEKILDEIRALRPKVAQSKDLDQKLTALAGASGGRGGGGRGGPAGPDTLNSVRGALGNLQRLIQGADVAPTAQETAAAADRRKAFAALQQRWTALQSELKQAGIP